VVVELSLLNRRISYRQIVDLGQKQNDICYQKRC